MKRRFILLIFFIQICCSTGWGLTSTKELAREHYIYANFSGYRCRAHAPWISQKRVDQRRINEMTQAVKLDPGNADYHYVLAELYEFTSLKNRSMANIEYQKAGELNPRYQVMRLYEKVNELYRKPSAEIEQLLKKAQLLDPDNALLDYDLAYYYASRNQLEKAHQMVRSGNRKPIIRLYVSPVCTDPEFKPSFPDMGLIRLDPIYRIRRVSQYLCLPEKTTYRLFTGGPVSPQTYKGTELDFPSLAQLYIQSGHREKALDVCDDALKMGTQIINVGPVRSFIASLAGINMRANAMEGKANIYYQSGDLKNLSRLQARYNKMRRQIDPIQSQAHLYFSKRSSSPDFVICANVLGISLYSQSLNVSGNKFNITRLMHWIMYYLIWYGVPLLTIFPFVICLVLLIGAFFQKNSELHSRNSRSIHLGLILFFLLGTIKISFNVYHGWNPVVRWADRRSQAVFYSGEKILVEKIIKTMK